MTIMNNTTINLTQDQLDTISWVVQMTLSDKTPKRWLPESLEISDLEWVEGYLKDNFSPIYLQYYFNELKQQMIEFTLYIQYKRIHNEWMNHQDYDKLDQDREQFIKRSLHLTTITELHDIIDRFS